MMSRKLQDQKMMKMMIKYLLSKVKNKKRRQNPNRIRQEKIKKK